MTDSVLEQEPLAVHYEPASIGLPGGFEHNAQAFFKMAREQAWSSLSVAQPGRNSTLGVSWTVQESLALTGLLPWKSLSNSWVMRVVSFALSGRHDAALKEISLAVSEAKESENFELFSKELQAVCLSSLPTVVLIGILRSTFSIRHHLVFWQTMRNEVENILDQKAENPKRLLRGL